MTTLIRVTNESEEGTLGANVVTVRLVLVDQNSVWKPTGLPRAVLHPGQTTRPDLHIWPGCALLIEESSRNA